ncbi:MAG: glycosyltransferase [Candidatus Omnitrophica bacterium]|nr:glycosyltransferase [Candidatus Omnitrophota bacterium]
MMRQTFFSVIIPTFNRHDLLKKAVDSVLDQTFGDLELVIVDDGSSDGTEHLIRGYTDRRIIYLRQDNEGVSRARNRGLELAAGRYIAFLDSDDRWVSEKLNRAVDYINRFPEIKIFHTEEIWYRKGKLLNQKKKHKKPTGSVYLKALPLCCISISTAVIEREVFRRVGNFDENLEACEDYDFWLRATSIYPVKLIPEYLTVKDGGRPDQLSSSVWGLDRYRIRALEKMLDADVLSDAYHEATLDELRDKCRVFSAGALKRGNKEAAGYYARLTEKYET